MSNLRETAKELQDMRTQQNFEIIFEDFVYMKFLVNLDNFWKILKKFQKNFGMWEYFYKMLIKFLNILSNLILDNFWQDLQKVEKTSKCDNTFIKFWKNVLARHATQQIVVGVGESKISCYKTGNKNMFHVPL